MNRTYQSRTLRVLILSLTAIAIIIGASTITLLYRTAYDETLLEMQQSSSIMANLIEAVAQFDKRYSEQTNPQGHWGATMSQVEAGMLMQSQTHQTGKIIIGRRIGSEIQVLRAIPGKGLQEVARVPFDGVLARPLFLALNGKSGSGELPDYSGKLVLAGYAPVPALEIGIVYKVDTALVRAPFIRAGVWAIAIGALLIILGSVIFAKVTRPLLRRVIESEQRLSALVANAPVGVFETDVNGHCTFVNTRWCEFSGLSADQAMGEGWGQALHPLDKEKIFSAWQAFITQGVPFAHEFRFLRPDSSVSWVFVQTSALLDSENRIRGYTGTVTDITDAFEARHALQRSDDHLKEAQRLARIGSWELDLLTNKLTWSDEIFHIFEIDKTRFDASYEAFLHAIHPEDRVPVDLAYRQSVENHTPYEIEHRLRMEDGRIKWVQERGEPFYDAAGSPIRATGTVQDISELKNAQLDLDIYRLHLERLVTERTAMLEAAQKIAKIGNWVWDLASNNLHWSNETYRIFGYDPEDTTPSLERNEARIHPDDLEMTRQFTRDVLDNKQPAGIDYRIMRTDGETRWAHGEASLSFDAVGNPETVSGTIQDISDRKLTEENLIQAKEEAEHANAAKNEFLSRMSHELRTPMNAILGFSQVLESESLSLEQQSFVAEIYRAGEHLLELINQLLDLSRIESGKLATLIEPVKLTPLLNRVLALAHTELQKQRINVITLCRDEVAVLADETRLRQILLNLTTNAAKYNREGGSIHIDCHERGDQHWRISITDTGPGISPNKLDKLFMPFERLGAEFTAVSGTGIGLNLSKKLAELMGAELGVSSIQGKGSTFWIDLPRAKSKDQATAAIQNPSSISPTIARKKVLYIEDNAANLKVIEAMLRHQPELGLISATNGEYGLELARRYQPDVILLDIHLPGMDGYAVLQALQRNPTTAHIPVLALSADALPIDIETGLKAGFVEYLTKPIKLENLLRALHQALDANTENAAQF